MPNAKRKNNESYYKNVVNLHLKNYTHEEIANSLGLSKSSVYRLILKYRKTKSLEFIKKINQKEVEENG